MYTTNKRNQHEAYLMYSPCSLLVVGWPQPLLFLRLGQRLLKKTITNTVSHSQKRTVSWKNRIPYTQRSDDPACSPTTTRLSRRLWVQDIIAPTPLIIVPLSVLEENRSTTPLRALTWGFTGLWWFQSCPSRLHHNNNYNYYNNDAIAGS